MTDQTPKTADEIIADIAQPAMEFFTALHAEFMKMGKALSDAMTQWAQSSAGQYVIAVARYYEEHPEKLDAMIAARAVERRDCHCVCQRWDHLGTCTGEASTDRLFAVAVEPVTVPLCQACADSIDGQRHVSSR